MLRPAISTLMAGLSSIQAVMRALIVAYYFPPKGGAGTQRFAKFCKFLPDHGIEPVVISVEPDLRNRNAPNDDATLLRDMPAAVVRVADPLRVPASLRYVVEIKPS